MFCLNSLKWSSEIKIDRVFHSESIAFSKNLHNLMFQESSCRFWNPTVRILFELWRIITLFSDFKSNSTSASPLSGKKVFYKLQFLGLMDINGSLDNSQEISKIGLVIVLHGTNQSINASVTFWTSQYTVLTSNFFFRKNIFSQSPANFET